MKMGEIKGQGWVCASLAMFAALALPGCMVESSDDMGVEEVGVLSEPLLGNQYVTVESEYGHASSRQLTASCPAEKVVYGAGYTALLDTGQLAAGTLKHFAPSADGTSWTANVRMPIGYKGVWKLQLTATCAPRLSGYQIKVSEVPHAPNQSLTVKAECAAPQREPTVRATGGGFGLFDSNGVPLEATLNAMPATGLSWSAKAHNSSGVTGTLKSYVICVAASAVEEYSVTATNKVWPSGGTEDPVTVSGYCPSGSWALSGGFQLLDQLSNTMSATWRQSRAFSRGGASGWLTTAYKPPSSVASKQIPTTLKQYILCVKNSPG